MSTYVYHPLPPIGGDSRFEIDIYRIVAGTDEKTNALTKMNTVSGNTKREAYAKVEEAIKEYHRADHERTFREAV